MANQVAYGFIGLQDFFNRRVAETGIERVWSSIVASVEEYNRVITAMLETLTTPTVLAQEQIESLGAGSLQPLSEWNSPLPVQPGPAYKVGYPILGGGTAFGDNRVTRALMTVEEYNQLTMDALNRDHDWMIRHVLAALLDNVAWTFNDKVGPAGAKGLGDISIQPLANGDATLYARRGAAPAIDTHYLAQLAAIDDANNPFPSIRLELVEHPVNTGAVVVQVASNLLTSITALAEFAEARDPDIAYGLGGDVAEVIQGIQGPGVEVLGKTKSSNCWIVDMPSLPSDYMVAYMLNSRPLAMRQYDAPELQGLRTEMAQPDGNLRESRFLRFTGFGARNRVGALAFRIGSATYSIPAGYDAPLAM